ncbi:urate oxidase [Terriglobus roseus DSM 18391]|uniref:Uricase n=1 Tax=Terriglobus roseus (strain DSM 18391 / NRRL B-41598 / KBS 63) TaxID=926566 RepID=I3ZD73_TERRK|nr:urate oxidase [Terriglobus roseus]AFL87191.1 urate oxidase [Terriglobus roseus DSM 18391]
MAILQENKYGKSGVRLVKVTRNGDVHTVREWTVRVLLEGDFQTAHTVGDNSKILPTDTMKNTVYSRAKESNATSMEEFAAELIDFLLGRNAQVSAVEVHIEQVMWKRLTVDGELHPHSFMRGSDELQTTTVRRAKSGETSLVSGLHNMIVLKTTKSSFEGYIKDDLTTLKEAADRLFETSVTASWLYAGDVANYNVTRTSIRESMLKTFATHDSKSVQQTLFAMAEDALAAVPELLEMTLTMPNIHNILVDLKSFAQENANEIFMPISDPSGYIHARVTRN